MLSDRRTAFPDFRSAFRRKRGLKVAPYLHLLNLMPPAELAVAVVGRCASRAKQPSVQVAALLQGEDGWRSQLVGCVAVLAIPAAERPLAALLDAAERPSWVSPQLLAALSLVGVPGWEATIAEGIRERGDRKAAAALAALVTDLPTDISALALLDVDGGGEIASAWVSEISAAFDKAGLTRTW